MELSLVNSIDALQAAAPRWNDLWRRSNCAWPTMRAEPLAHGLRAFSPSGSMLCLTVEKNNRLVAALPLYTSRVARVVPVGRLPGGDLSSIGDLLLDEGLFELDREAALDLLVDHLRRQSWPIVTFDAMFPQSRRWQEFVAAADRAGLKSVQRNRGITGLVDIAGYWDEYFASRSRNHRRSMRVIASRAEKEEGVRLKLHADPPPQKLAALLRLGFEIEDRSWKGAAGSSVLRTPGAFDYFCEQAELIARDRGLLLTFLELDGRPIAFEYGWLLKGVYSSLKVGYDAEFERLSPGQLLRMQMLEHFHATNDATLVDYLGPLCDATAKWCTRTYAVDRLLVATGTIGATMLYAYEQFMRIRTTSHADIGVRSLPEPEHIGV